MCIRYSYHFIRSKIKIEKSPKKTKARKEKREHAQRGYLTSIQLKLHILLSHSLTFPFCSENWTTSPSISPTTSPSTLSYDIPFDLSRLFILVPSSNTSKNPPSSNFLFRPSLRFAQTQSSPPLPLFLLYCEIHGRNRLIDTLPPYKVDLFLPGPGTNLLEDFFAIN